MYFKELDLPPIPEELLDFEFKPSIGVDDIGYGRTHTKNGKTLTPCSYWFSKNSNPKLNNWIYENIIQDSKSIEVGCQLATDGVHIVHSDINRKYAINYMIELGGDNAWTSWYKEADMPLDRSKRTISAQADTGYVGYENLELLETVKFEKNKWYLIVTNILHDVDEIVGNRKSISISVRPYKEKRILKMLGIQDDI
jgi:hypothetical protein